MLELIAVLLLLFWVAASGNFHHIFWADPFVSGGIRLPCVVQNVGDTKRTLTLETYRIFRYCSCRFGFFTLICNLSRGRKTPPTI